MTDFPLPAPDPTRPAREPARCRVHQWEHRYSYKPESTKAEETVACFRCGAVRDDTRVRRGRLANQRGRRIQHDVLVELGLTNIVGNAVNHDGGRYDEMFAAEVKSGGAFPERIWRWLKGVPVLGSQTAIVIVTDAPGPGHRRRAVVVLDFEDWRLLHGPTGGEE